MGKKGGKRELAEKLATNKTHKSNLQNIDSKGGIIRDGFMMNNSKKDVINTQGQKDELRFF